MHGVLTGHVIHDYLFGDLIGTGGFSQVYRVHSNHFNQDFCAKVISVDEQHVESKWKSFQTELDSLQKLDHPHIIRLYEHFRENNRFFLILEYCEFGSLLDYIRKEPNISESQINVWISQILESVAYCHSCGIAHRDIKPGNFLLDHFKRVKLADFGISLLVNSDKTSDCTCSRMFAPPEVLKKHEHDAIKADIWSLGVTLYYLITGTSPWPVGDTTNSIIIANVGYPPDFPVQHRLLLMKMINEDPNDRITVEKAYEWFQNLLNTSQIPGSDLLKHPRLLEPLKLGNSPVLRAGIRVSGWKSMPKIPITLFGAKSRMVRHSQRAHSENDDYKQWC